MNKTGEHKTVQARILAYAQEIGWSLVSREEAEERRGGIPAPLRKKDGDRNRLRQGFGGRDVPAPLEIRFHDIIAHRFVAKGKLCDKSSILLSR